MEKTDNKLVVNSPKRQLSLKQKVDIETENRKVLTRFITDHMKSGVDYVKIHISKTCPNKYNCTNKYHFSKDSLSKAGAEKIRSLLRLRPETVMDRETWEMSGSKAGHFCYRCNLYDMVTGELVGDGLGACTIEEKGNLNNAIKIAKKRAFVDAILSTGSLSDFFTQDLEDMHNLDETETQTPKQMREEIDREENKKEVVINKISNDQKLLLLKLLGEKGKTVIDLNKFIKDAWKGKVESYQYLTSSQAEWVIKKLEKMEVKKIEDLDEDIEDVMKDEALGINGEENERG